MFGVCVFYILSLLLVQDNAVAESIRSLGDKKPCVPNMSDCEIDGYVGSDVIYEDHLIRMWNFTLAPGEMTSLHRHDYDYHFVVINPTQLEVYDEKGKVLFDFRAEGTIGFTINGDFLDPINIKLPYPVPRIHAARNIGPNVYYEILFESKPRSSQINEF